jgi:hypothetical protein
MSPTTLDDPTVAEVLDAIVTAPEAWSEWDRLAERWPGVLERLEAGGLVERWERPDYRAVTLTPIAAHRRRVWLSERLHWVTRDTGHGPQPKPHRVPEVYPTWSGVEDSAPAREPKPPGEVQLLFPNRVIDRKTPVFDEEREEPLMLFGRVVPAISEN